jgi:hypothetical protein
VLSSDPLRDMEAIIVLIINRGRALIFIAHEVYLWHFYGSPHRALPVRLTDNIWMRTYLYSLVYI